MASKGHYRKLECCKGYKKDRPREFQKYFFDDDPVWSSLKQRFIGISEGRKGILETFVGYEAKGLPSAFHRRISSSQLAAPHQCLFRMHALNRRILFH